MINMHIKSISNYSIRIDIPNTAINPIDCPQYDQPN